MLPPDTESVMASYKEPLKSVAGGFGYYGTIAYDISEQYTQCHICGFFYQKLGMHVNHAHELTADEYRIEYGLPPRMTLTAPKLVNKRYEIWEAMTPEEKKKKLAQLNSGPRPTNQPWQKSLFQKNKEGRCPDQLLDKIEALAKKLGRAPTKREFYKEYNGFLSSVVLTYGSWGEALKILGLTPKRSGQADRYDSDSLLTLLVNFQKQHRREPMATDIERGLLPSHNTFRKHFGTWAKAKEEAKVTTKNY